MNVYINGVLLREASDYTYAMPPSTPYRQQYYNCFKRFVFRKEQDAMIFQLRWAE